MATKPQPPIDETLLGKFLAGEASAAEADQVRRWLSEPANQTEFARFERIWLTASLLKPTSAVDTDAAWQRVQQRMHRPTGAVQDEVIRPLPVLPRRSIWPAISRVAAVVLLVGIAGLVIRQMTRSKEMTSNSAHLIASASSQPRRLQLPDGSRVLLNQNSRLTYPDRFADSTRAVALTGEAFFDVKPDAAHPFLIRAGRTMVRVLGTSFSVRAVGDSVRVAVRTGRVRLSTPRQSVELTRNQQVTYQEKADTLRSIRPLNTNLLAYQTGRLTFVSTSLGEVVQTLREVYGADIRLSNPALETCRLTASFGREPLDTVLAVVAETLTLTIRREGNTRILTGTGCGL